jgi:hypothetical protein
VRDLRRLGRGRVFHPPRAIPLRALEAALREVHVEWIPVLTILLEPREQGIDLGIVAGLQERGGCVVFGHAIRLPRHGQ